MCQGSSLALSRPLRQETPGGVFKLVVVMDKSTNLDGIKNKMAGTSSPIVLDMTQLLLLGKVEYGGGPIFEVVLCRVLKKVF